MVGLLDYRGMTVRYMPHMPELQDVSGKARYEGGTLHFDVASGSAVGLRVSGATIDLTGLDGPSPQNATIRLPIAGSARGRHPVPGPAQARPAEGRALRLQARWWRCRRSTSRSAFH